MTATAFRADPGIPGPGAAGSEPDDHAGIYRYDDLDRRFVAERVEQFSKQVARRLAGELTEDEFKPLRLMNGLYLQLHAYMLRIAVPYGVLTTTQFRKLSEIGRKYDKGYGHFTTRQNLQFNWIKLEDTPAILGELAEVDMHALQTSGNCVRNVTTDQFVGASADEIVDGRVYAEILRQWTIAHPEFTYLPRKFKIAIMGSDSDRAAIRTHDVGVIAKRNEAGETGFTFYVGGGLGRSPFVGKLVREWVPEQDFAAYLEAILRVYNQYGRRDNIYKARIKILVHQLGIDKFKAEVEEEFDRLPRPKFTLAPEIVEGIRARFASPGLETLPAESAEFERRKSENVEFARWATVNLAAHKAPGYAIVSVSLKPAGGIPGDITSEQMDTLADLADRYSFGEIRVTHAQNLVLAHVRKDDLFDLWRQLDAIGLATANIGLIGDIIACPGLDYCALANARSIPLAQAISARFADPARQQAIGELGIKISGCINACGHHHVGHIGILGVDKRGEERYQITIGGDATLTTAIGDIIGPAVTEEAAVDAIDTMVEIYLANRTEGERFLDTIRRIGHGPFKESIYAAD
jgi:sulfite reductase (NADPH) hemoprotein beta-component